MKILALGVSVRALAESAIASGYNVVGLDSFGDLDLESMCECYSLRRDYHYPFSAEGLYKASRRLSFDSIVYTANLENHPDVVGRLARNSRIFGNSKETLTRVRHWPSVFAALSSAGFRTPETVSRKAIRQPDQTRKWLIKPVLGGGGHRVTYWRDGNKLSRDCMLQEYISGISCSASFVSNGQEAVVIGMTEQLAGLPEFGGREFNYCGNLMPLTTGDGYAYDAKLLREVQKIATLLTREFGLVGVNVMDFILADGQVCLLEVNPRYSSSMELIEKAYHLPIFDLHIRASSTNELPGFDLASKAGKPEHFFGKAILYADKDSQARRTETWMQRGIRDIPHPGEKLSSGKPICTVFASGLTRDDCFAGLVAAGEKLKGEIYG